MTITKTVTLETDDEMIDDIIEELQGECEHWATILLDKTNFDFDPHEYSDYHRKITKEIFDDVVARLIFESEAE